VEQTNLFDLREPEPAPLAVPGFTIQKDYLSPQEEQELITHIDSGPWDTEWRRRVQRYGLGYGSSKRTVISDSFPDWLTPLASRVQYDAGFERFPENCVINEYLPGQGIAPHKDYSTFGPKVACVSLGSTVLLDFHAPDLKEKHSILVPPRSLWIIQGDARDKWLHGISPRLFDLIQGQRKKRERRISITFRLKKS
jgi:alkylated DNA repair dioxygenase AlkB